MLEFCLVGIMGDNKELLTFICVTHLHGGYAILIVSGWQVE